MIKIGKWRWHPGFSAAQSRMQHRTAEAVRAWLDQKGYTKALATQQAIAADIGVPSDQLRIYIRIRHHCSVLAWRKELRVLEACQLLLDYPDLPISVIGEMVGISDRSNFKRMFGQSKGMSPRAWREKHATGGTASGRRPGAV